MGLGIDDFWVGLALYANIAATAVCVIYGIFNYNRGDDSNNC